jgi:Zn-dependent protease
MFGFPIDVNLSFLLLLAFVFIAYGGLTGVLIVGLAFGSVVLHELGHAVVARQRHVHVSGIELGFLGGAAKMTEMPRSANDEIAIAAAGPAVSLMLGGLGFGLGAAVHSQWLLAIGAINFILAAFNLIPALPMDGGRILRAVLSRRMGFVRATDVAVQVSRVAAVAFGVYGLVFGAYQLLILAPFLWMMGTRERAMARSMGDTYVGWGRGPGRRGGPFDGPGGGGGGRGGGGGGFYRSSDRGADDQPIRQFVIRHIGGRTVIEAIE